MKMRGAVPLFLGTLFEWSVMHCAETIAATQNSRSWYPTAADASRAMVWDELWTRAALKWPDFTDFHWGEARWSFCQPDVTANLKPNQFQKAFNDLMIHHAHSPKCMKCNTKDPPASKHQLCCRVAAETACELARLSTTNEGLSISTLPTVLSSSNGVPLVESLEDSVELQLSYRTGLRGWWSLVCVHVHLISFVGEIDSDVHPILVTSVCVLQCQWVQLR